MNTSYAPRVLIAALACAFAGAIHGQPSARLAKCGFDLKDFLLGGVLNTSDWMSIEASVDLSTWTPIASVASTNTAVMLLVRDSEAHPLRFYRLKHPDAAVEELELRWQSPSASDYRFEVRHVRSRGPPYVLTGTVTVVGGQKSISGAEGDGRPLAQPVPADFPSVGEMFTALKHAQQVGCWRVAVTYDAADGHPLWCVFEWQIGPLRSTSTDQFWITNLVYLTSGNGS